MYNRLWAKYLFHINLSFTGMNKQKLSAAIIALVIILILVSCKNHNKSQQGPPPVPVVSYTAKEADAVYYDTYPGTAVSTDEVQLRSQVSGYVTGIYFKEGSKVHKGRKLYEIDRRKYQAAYEAAKAAVQIANANLQKSQRDADRYKKLDEQNAIAKQVLDDAITNLQNTQEAVKSSKANLVNAETDFNYSLITAPFTGTIGLSQVKPGAFVTAGQTLLNTISSDDPIAVDFIVDENSLPYLVKLHNVKTNTQDSTFKLILPDNSNYKYNGKLSIIDRAVDPQTGTIKIRTLFPNPDDVIRPGTNCKVKVLNENSGSSIEIPFRAMIEQMGEYFVYVIMSGDTVKQKRIMAGPTHGEFVLVKSGLNPGDKIVVDGIQKIHQGSVVSESDASTNRGTGQNNGTPTNPEQGKGNKKGTEKGTTDTQKTKKGN
jgi:RND family efflux transporter MFP subunit